MEWKILFGQGCMTIIALACIFAGIDHYLIYTVVGALAGSMGLPYVLGKKEAETSQS